MGDPLYFAVEPPASFDPDFDWFPVVVKIVKQIGHEIDSTETLGDLLTIRAGQSATFIPATIQARRTPNGFAIRWAISEVKRRGWRQRIVGASGEGPARFYIVMHEEYRAQVRKLSDEERKRLFPKSADLGCTSS